MKPRITLLLAPLCVVCGFTIAVAESSTQPAALLAESFALAKKRADHGDPRTMAMLRLGATMRMAGLKLEAVAAFEECIALNERDSDADSTRDETKIELAREFFLLGMKDRARSLLTDLKAREYDLVGQGVLARVALESGDTAEAERAVHAGLALAQRPQRKFAVMGHPMLCQLARAALELKMPDLARQFEVVVTDSFWKSVMLGDQAEALASEGRTDEALRAASQATDQHLAVIAHARVAVALVRRGQPADAAVTALQQAATKIKDADERDFALRIASGKLAAAGETKSAAAVASRIQSPGTRLLAMCPISPGDVMPDLAKCAPNDQPLLAEAIVVACAAKGLAADALAASAQVPPGWPRVRALCDAAQRMAKTKTRGEAVKLLAAAKEELPRVTDAGWRCHAQAQIALAAHQAGDAKAADMMLADACRDALRLESADDLQAVLPRAVQAALTCGFRELAATTLGEALRRKPDAALRNALVPLLVESGRADDAVAETTTARLADPFAQRFVSYRLAKVGRLADALSVAANLDARAQAEALADIAFAQLKRPLPAKRNARTAGLSLHGGWMYWTAQLERLGVAWEVMPFSLPYEEGAEGLTARYAMLGYPGAGDHHYQVSAVGEEHVRDYLSAGGGLFGICAGQLFATGHPTGHQFLPSGFYYLRGEGPHQVQVAPRHPASVGLPPQVIINRKNGDFLLPRPGCDVLGWYDKENLCAAVATARYGLGRVAVSSPHPESGRGLGGTERVFIALMLWTLEGTP